MSTGSSSINGRQFNALALSMTHPIDVLDLTDDIFTGHHETGTIDLVFHPQFPDKRYAYVTYSAKGGAQLIRGCLVLRSTRT